jgi:hypothetical protein
MDFAPKIWTTPFDPIEYRLYQQMPEQAAPLIPHIEGLASGLDARGAMQTALKVRAGGLATQKSIWETGGPEVSFQQFVDVQEYLEFLDREVGEGVQTEMTFTGQSARVLCNVLQGFANNVLSSVG